MTAIHPASRPHGRVVSALLSGEAWITRGDDFTTKAVAPTRLIYVLAALASLPLPAFVLGMMMVRMLEAI